AVNERGAHRAVRVTNLAKLVGIALGKGPRDGFLVFSQDVHGKGSFQLKLVVQAGPFLNADQHQWRFERQRAESGDRNAGRSVVVANQRHHGHRGGEVTQGLAKFCFLNGHVTPSWSAGTQRGRIATTRGALSRITESAATR